MEYARQAQEPVAGGLKGVRRVTVVGCGLIGTSVALALRPAGVEVFLHDRDMGALAEAEARGAGTRLRPGGPRVDVVVIATPPSAVAGVLRDAQLRDLGSVYTDVASTKANVVAEAEAMGCDLGSFVPGHPMAGRELSGPAAARADLFSGRQWALCPGPEVPPRHLDLVAELAVRCGGVPMVFGPEAHDRIAAAVSHAPHVVSSALAARFADAGRSTLSLVGRGLRGTTRIAAGPPDLWRDVLEQNAEQIAPVLEAVAADLAAAAQALRSSGPARSRVLTELLVRGNLGRANIAGFPAPEPGQAAIPMMDGIAA
jgi:prephenate dehydrogenase